MLLANEKIYNLTQNLIEAFQDEKQKLPIKFNFIIQKNKKTLLNLSREIENSRINILSQYGKLNKETNNYEFTKENTDIANKELQDLLDIEQEVNIVKIKMKDIENSNVDLTVAQMDAIMFMIEDEAEDKPAQE